MADIQIENITPTALDATDRALVRRGAGPLDHTMALVDLGGAAVLDVGTGAGTVAAGNHTHTASAITDFATAVAATAVQPAAIAQMVVSNPTGITGADAITNMISLTQAEYDALPVKHATTLYVITLPSGEVVYSPGDLFANGEQGAWFDPSDLTTLFQDTAGTTPVTTPGQTVGLMLDKSQGLALGPELVTNGTFASNVTSWTGVNAALSQSSGSCVITADGAGGARASQVISTVAGRWYEARATLAQGTGAVNVNLLIAGIASSALVSSTTPTVVVVRFAATGATTTIRAGSNGTAAAGTTYIVDNISVRELPGNHATQPTASARPVYQVDAGGRGYLAFDGVDDFLVTPTITPGTDKVQVFAGVRKLSDAATGAVLGLSAVPWNTSGCFEMYAPLYGDGYGFGSRGTGGNWAEINPMGYPAPTSSVVVGLGDISGDRATLRVKAVQVAQSTVDQGVGNFLAYPLFIGRRGGTSLPFNGNLYSLIARFGANLTADQITATETWVAAKTGVTL